MTSHPYLLIFWALWIYGSAFMSGRNLTPPWPDRHPVLWCTVCLALMLLVWPLSTADLLYHQWWLRRTGMTDE
jgi:hypothetical protein